MVTSNETANRKLRQSLCDSQTNIFHELVFVRTTNCQQGGMLFDLCHNITKHFDPGLCFFAINGWKVCGDFVVNSQVDMSLSSF